MRRLGMVLLAILFLFMVFAGPVTQKADAVVVSTVVIGAVIAAMAAAGIGLTVSGMTSAQLTDWVSGKLNEWATSLGGTVQDHIDGSDITATGRGFLSLGTLAATSISQFIDWLQTEDSITDNSTVVIEPGSTTLNGYQLGTLPFSFTSPQSTVDASSDNTTYYYYRRNTDAWDPNVKFYNMYFISKTVSIVTSHYVEGQWNLTGTNNVNQLYNGYYYDSNRMNFTIPETAPNFNSSFIHEVFPTDIIGPGYDVVENGSLSYDTGTIVIPTIQTDDKWFLDVGAVPGSTVETVTDGVIADTIDGSLTVSGEVAEEEPEFVVNEPIGVSGLTEVFPFCIPFDVYALLSCLSAEPQTPIFTVRFVIPGVINQEFTIDLSPFSTIAQIVRTMELIAFAVGLALVTRERFLRS